MSFLEEICSGKYNLVFMIVTILFFYLFNQKNVEKMSNVPNVDVASIKTLADFAKKLQEGGVTHPGKLQVNGMLKVNRNVSHPWNEGWGNGVHTWDLKVDASADINHLIVKGNKSETPQNPDGNLRITSQGIMFGGPNAAGKEVSSAQISAGRHVANSLNIVGMSSNNQGSTRKVDMWAEGGFNLHGNRFCIGGTCIDEDDLKMIRNYFRNDMNWLVHWQSTNHQEHGHIPSIGKSDKFRLIRFIILHAALGYNIKKPDGGSIYDFISHPWHPHGDGTKRFGILAGNQSATIHDIILPPNHFIDFAHRAVVWNDWEGHRVYQDSRISIVYRNLT
jgi:hypothetical protein